ncbi:hypothetical protein [Devosia sp.]|uniref:hypothetical protein n=1 Tax=Devosia sp. TaxID=1871048 RepID=UPI003A905ACD
MTLNKLARELDETARQSAALVDGITEALELLSSSDAPSAQTRKEVARMIISALQGQDRIEQRCNNMALAVRQFALLPPGTNPAVYDEIWAELVLDELRVPSLTSAGHLSNGDAELF